MLESRIFQVPTQTLIDECEGVLARLADESDSRLEAFRAGLGVDLAAMRGALETSAQELRDVKAKESEAVAALAQGDDAGADPGPAQAWLAEVQRVADAYLAANGTDDIALAGRLRLGKQDPSSLANLRQELCILVPEASSLRDRLRNAGFSDDFVARGWAALEAAGGKRIASVDDLIRLEDVNRNSRKVEARLVLLRASLAGLEEFLLARDSRAPRKYALDQLAIAARRARARILGTTERE